MQGVWLVWCRVAVLLVTLSPALAVRAEMERSSGVAVRMPPRPPILLTTDELRATLQRARPDLESCLEQAPRSRAALRVSLHVRRGLTVGVHVTPRNEAIRQCLDTAVRRWTTLLESRPLASRVVTASLRIGPRTGLTPPPPPPPNNNTYDEAHVHEALNRRRFEILRCVPRLAPGTPGSIVLRTSVRPDGSLVLEGATLPSGLGDPAALVCLGELVARVRVPAPDSVRSVTHALQLGR